MGPAIEAAKRKAALLDDDATASPSATSPQTSPKHTATEQQAELPTDAGAVELSDTSVVDWMLDNLYPLLDTADDTARSIDTKRLRICPPRRDVGRQPCCVEA